MNPRTYRIQNSDPDCTQLAIGDLAPGFVLRRTFEESVNLGDLISGGPVLLAFYVFDFGHV